MQGAQSEAGTGGTQDAGDGDELLNERMCIVSRGRFEPEALIRFVRAPDGTVAPDLKRKLPGRGAHVEARRGALEAAVKRRLFAKAFRREVVGTEALPDMVDALLARNALGALGLARKAGQLVAGAAKVEAALRSGAAIALIGARDGAADGLRKMEGARRAGEAASGRRMPAHRPFSTDELGLALGGVNVIHAAVLAGNAGSAAAKRLEALARYRGEEPAATSQDDPDGSSGTAPDQFGERPLRDAPGTDEARGSDPAQEAEA